MRREQKGQVVHPANALGPQDLLPLPVADSRLVPCLAGRWRPHRHRRYSAEQASSVVVGMVGVWGDKLSIVSSLPNWLPEFSVPCHETV